MSAAGRLRAIAGDVAAVPRAVLPDALELVDRLAVDEARRATGDGRMSGIGRGAKLRTVARRRTTSTSAGAEIRGVPAAGWALLEGGAIAHRIAPRPGRAMAGALGHPVAVPLRHPGHRGRRVWSIVARRAGDAVPDLYADAVTRAVR